MKKIVAFIVAFLYLGITTGLAVNIHYCMGKVADVAFESLSDDACSCGKKSKMPCCKHDYHLVKVDDEHQQVVSAFLLKSPETVSTAVDDIVTRFLLPVTQKEIINTNSPPLISPHGIYLQNCVFII